MSSILASLDMSLDDLIAKKKTPKSSNPDSRAASRANKGKGAAKPDASAGPVRGREGRNRRSRGGARNQPYGRSVSDHTRCFHTHTATNRGLPRADENYAERARAAAVDCAAAAVRAGR